MIKNADKKSLDLSKDLMDISERARSGKLKPNELNGGTFTISSLGGIGGTYFTPIINPPEVAIMGISKMFEVIYNHKSKEMVPTPPCLFHHMTTESLSERSVLLLPHSFKKRYLIVKHSNKFNVFKNTY